MNKKIHHIAIAVRDIEKALSFYSRALNLNVESEQTVESQGVKVAFLRLGDTHLELLEPLTPESPVAKYLEKKGEGIHHIAIEVDDISSEINRLQKQGIQLIDSTPRLGAQGNSVAFLHPKASFGALIELVERPKNKIK